LAKNLTGVNGLDELARKKPLGNLSHGVDCQGKEAGTSRPQQKEEKKYDGYREKPFRHELIACTRLWSVDRRRGRYSRD